MKKYTLSGIIFIMVGFTAVANQVITHTTREKAGSSGHLQVTADKTITLTRQPIVRGIALLMVSVFSVSAFAQMNTSQGAA